MLTFRRAIVRPLLRLHHTVEALERWPRTRPLISCSSHWRRPRASVDDTFELLERYGRDITGALVISFDPPGEHRFAVIHASDGPRAPGGTSTRPPGTFDAFGFSTESGFGRRDPETVAPLLELRAEASAATG